MFFLMTYPSNLHHLRMIQYDLKTTSLYAGNIQIYICFQDTEYTDQKENQVLEYIVLFDLKVHSNVIAHLHLDPSGVLQNIPVRPPSKLLKKIMAFTVVQHIFIEGLGL